MEEETRGDRPGTTRDVVGRVGPLGGVALRTDQRTEGRLGDAAALQQHARDELWGIA
jgi:hypothetical protein